MKRCCSKPNYIYYISSKNTFGYHFSNFFSACNRGYSCGYGVVSGTDLESVNNLSCLGERVDIFVLARS